MDKGCRLGCTEPGTAGYLTVPEVEAAEGGDGDEGGADPVQTHGEPARGGQEQEPGLWGQRRGPSEGEA